jgi:hypothetical protein
VECVVLVVIGPAKEERDVSEISSLTVNSNPSPQSQAYTVVKLKNLRKKVRRLEKRLQEGQKKTGQAKAEAAGSTDSEGDESCEETGCTRYYSSPGSEAFYANRNEVPYADDRVEEAKRQQKSEEKTQSLTGTPCATCGSDESQVGCEENR